MVFNTERCSRSVSNKRPSSRTMRVAAAALLRVISFLCFGVFCVVQVVVGEMKRVCLCVCVRERHATANVY